MNNNLINKLKKLSTELKVQLLVKTNGYLMSHSILLINRPLANGLKKPNVPSPSSTAPKYSFHFYFQYMTHIRLELNSRFASDNKSLNYPS